MMIGGGPSTDRSHIPLTRCFARRCRSSRTSSPMRRTSSPLRRGEPAIWPSAITSPATTSPGLGAPTLLGRPILPDDDSPARPRGRGADSPILGPAIRFRSRRAEPGDPSEPRTAHSSGRHAAVLSGAAAGPRDRSVRPISMVAGSGPAYYSLAAPDVWWVQVFARLKPGISEQAATAAMQQVFARHIEAVRRFGRQRAKDAAPRAGAWRPGRGSAARVDRKRDLHSRGRSGDRSADCVRKSRKSAAGTIQRPQQRNRDTRFHRGEPRTAAAADARRKFFAGRHGRSGRTAACKATVPGDARSFFGNGCVGSGRAPRPSYAGFTFAISIGTGLLFGTLPAWRAAQVNPAPALKETASIAAGAERSCCGARPRVVSNRALPGAGDRHGPVRANAAEPGGGRPGF